MSIKKCARNYFIISFDETGQFDTKKQQQHNKIYDNDVDDAVMAINFYRCDKEQKKNQILPSHFTSNSNDLPIDFD